MNTEENCQKQDRRGENMVLAVKIGVVSAGWGENRRIRWRMGGQSTRQEETVGDREAQ